MKCRIITLLIALFWAVLFFSTTEKEEDKNEKFKKVFQCNKSKIY
jgi:hypothetical protein